MNGDRSHAPCWEASSTPIFGANVNHASKFVGLDCLRNGASCGIYNKFHSANIITDDFVCDAVFNFVQLVLF